jgi:hypothetical protein
MKDQCGGHLVEAASQGTEIKETAHSRPDMADTITPCVDATTLSDQQQSDFVNMAATAVRFLKPLRIGRQPVHGEKQAHTNEAT